MAEPTALADTITVNHGRSSRRRLVMGGLAAAGGLGLGLTRPGRAHAAQSLSSPVTIDVPTGQLGWLSFLRGGDTKWSFIKQANDEFWVFDHDADAPGVKFTPGGSDSGVSHVLLAPLGGKVGIGTWSGAPTALLELGRAGQDTTALTDLVVSDVAHGADIPFDEPGFPGLPGARWQLAHGSVGDPVVTASGASFQPTFKVSRTSRADGKTRAQGATLNGAAIMAVHHAASSATTGQVVGITGSASTSSVAHPTGNADCEAFMGSARITGSGNGVAIGAYLEGITKSASGSANALEVQTRNQAGVTPTLNTTGLSQITGVWVALNDGPGSAGVAFSNIAGHQWLAGIHFLAQANGGTTGAINPITGASIRDDGNGATSLQINGNHTYAITVGATAGSVVIGAPAGVGGGSKATIRTTDPAANALKLQAAASQAVHTLIVLDSAATPIFGVASSGSVRMYDGKDLIMGAGGTGCKIGTAVDQKLAFFGVTPKVQPSALTSRNNTSLPATWDSTAQTIVDNMRTRINELESRFNGNTSTGLGLIAGTA